MQDVLQLYIDDIIIYANTNEECMSKLRAVLNQAAKFNLKMKWSKCHFLKNRIDLLGHTVEMGKIRPGQEKTQAVQRLKCPFSANSFETTLRSFAR